MTVLGAHPARLDLVVHPGDPVEFTESVLDDDGTAADLTSWAVAAVISAPDGQLLHTFTTTVPSPATGVIQVAATSTETAAWRWPVYAGRLVLTATPPGGSAIPITTGWVRLYRP